MAQAAMALATQAAPVLRRLNCRFLPTTLDSLDFHVGEVLTGCGNTRLLRKTQRSTHAPSRYQDNPQEAQNGRPLVRRS